MLTSQPPEKVPARQPFNFTAVVEDAFGNVVTDYNGSVTASLATAPRHAAIRGPLTVLATGGVADFTNSMSKKYGPGYSLSVSGTGLDATTSSGFKVTHPNHGSSAFSARLRHGGFAVRTWRRGH